MATPTPPPTPPAGAEPLTTRKAPRIGKSFSARNPTPIGAIGLVFLLLLLYAAFNASSLPLIGGGTQYTAWFTEAANLKSGDDVRIAGVKVGEVQSVSVVRKYGLVQATFTVKSGWVGDESTVDIKLRTLLGAKYLSVNSIGTKPQDPSKIICDRQSNDTCARTTSPLDVYPAFTELTKTIQDINTKNLATAVQTLAEDFHDTPADVRPVITGLSRISETISSRDQQLHDLLTAAQGVTGTLAARDQQLTQLIEDGNLLLQELNARRDAIHLLLVNTQTLTAQLRGLVADNQKTIGPLLDNLDQILTLLEKNQASLDRGISLLGPFYRLFNNVIGNGRWFDNYIQDLTPNGVLCLLGVATCDNTGAPGTGEG